MANQRFYGATYSTEKGSFGEIISVFEVPSDWDGYRFHGYCWAPAEAVETYLKGGNHE